MVKGTAVLIWCCKPWCPKVHEVCTPCKLLFFFSIMGTPGSASFGSLSLLLGLSSVLWPPFWVLVVVVMAFWLLPPSEPSSAVPGDCDRAFLG